jgi:hypothetical protein
MKTRDIDIRKCLHERIQYEYKEDDDTIVVDELTLCQGDARIDLAVINGSMHGYEIKSESDTLERLPNQIMAYNQVMDTITIVTGECHLDKVIDMIPTWWGISITSKFEDNKIQLIDVRKSSDNPDINPLSVAQLLWKEEALSILKELGLHKGYLSKPRNILWERLASSLSLEDLQCHVRKKLKSRKNWRIGKL